MGGIYYNGKKLEPAPFVSLNKSYNETQSGEHVGTVWNISLDGKFVPYKGSPDSTGFLYSSGVPTVDENLSASEYMSAVLRKQEALRILFADDGKQLYIEGWDNVVASGVPTKAIYCNPRIKGPLEFPKGTPTSWASIADYRINLEADIIYSGSGTIEDSGDPYNYKVSEADESWSIEPQEYDIGSYRLTHEVSAKGKRFYSSSGTLDKASWENAKDYCLNAMQLGLVNQFMYATGVLNDSNLQGYNYVRSQKVGEKAGTFSVSESFIAFNPNGGAAATDFYEADTRLDLNGVAKVTLKGKVEGFEVRDTTTRALTSTKSANAQTKFLSIVNNFLTRASGLADVTLNPTPLSRTIGNNPINGIITYSFEYDNRPINVVSGAVSENVSITFDYPNNVYASLPVLGREAGPILQSIQTVTSRKKTVVYEAVLAGKTMTYTPTKPDVNTFISGFVPVATYVFKDRDSELWVEKEGRFSRSITWSFNN